MFSARDTVVSRLMLPPFSGHESVKRGQHQCPRYGGNLSERQISLDKQTIRELKAHKARQNTERLAAGDQWTDSGFVFTTETGQPLHPAYVTEQFQQLAMEAGLPPVRLHDLRHGAATILLRAGHDMKVVQETLGLSSITIASDTYTSVLPDLARQSAEDAAAVIHRATKQRRSSNIESGGGYAGQPAAS
jgi:integrase